MARPTRAHKPHNSHAQGADDLPLDYTEELRRLMRVYEAYPGIVGDLFQLVADLERQADSRRSA
jgi:hypothetical protein